jgi:hypothetical protein
MTKLHGFFRSGASYRVRVALALKGIDYDGAFTACVLASSAPRPIWRSTRKGWCPRWKSTAWC